MADIKVIIMREVGMKAVILALSCDYRITNKYRLAKFVRCHGVGDTIVINLLTFDVVELGVWMMYSQCAGIFDHDRVRPMVDNKIANMIPGLENMRDRHRKYYNHVMWEQMEKNVASHLRIRGGMPYIVFINSAVEGALVVVKHSRESSVVLLSGSDQNQTEWSNTFDVLHYRSLCMGFHKH